MPRVNAHRLVWGSCAVLSGGGGDSKATVRHAFSSSLSAAAPISPFERKINAIEAVRHKNPTLPVHVRPYPARGTPSGMILPPLSPSPFRPAQLVQKDEGGRGIGKFVMPPGELLRAARRLHTTCTVGHAEGAVVTVLTGFPCNMDYTPATETDGPPGAVAIARAVLGADAVRRWGLLCRFVSRAPPSRPARLKPVYIPSLNQRSSQARERARRTRSCGGDGRLQPQRRGGGSRWVRPARPDRPQTRNAFGSARYRCH